MVVVLLAYLCSVPISLLRLADVIVLGAGDDLCWCVQQLLIDAYLLCFIDLAVTDWPIDAGDRVRVRFDGDEMYDGEVKLVGDTAGRELQVLFDDDELSWNARVDITDLLERAPETTGNDAHASTFTRNPP